VASGWDFCGFIGMHASRLNSIYYIYPLEATPGRSFLQFLKVFGGADLIYFPRNFNLEPWFVN